MGSYCSDDLRWAEHPTVEASKIAANVKETVQAILIVSKDIISDRPCLGDRWRWVRMLVCLVFMTVTLRK